MSVPKLTQAMRRFQDAVELRDRRAVEEFLHEDFALVLIHPVLAVFPRSRWLDVLDDYVIRSHTVEEQVVDQHDDVAAVLSRVQMEATVMGQDRSGPFIFSDFWRLGEDGWRIWRRHSSPLTAGSLPTSA